MIFEVYISGNRSKSDKQDEVTEWHKNDKKEKSDITLSTEPSLLKDVRDPLISKKVWQKPKQIYGSKGLY